MLNHWQIVWTRLSAQNLGHTKKLAADITLILRQQKKTIGLHAYKGRYSRIKLMANIIRSPSVQKFGIEIKSSPIFCTVVHWLQYKCQRKSLFNKINGNFLLFSTWNIQNGKIQSPQWGHHCTKLWIAPPVEQKRQPANLVW